MHNVSLFTKDWGKCRAVEVSLAWGEGVRKPTSGKSVYRTVRKAPKPDFLNAEIWNALVLVYSSAGILEQQHAQQNP